MSASANFVTQVQLPGSTRSLPLITRWHLPQDVDNPPEAGAVCFDCIVVDRLMRQAWTGSASQHNLSQSLSWGKDTLLRLKEILTSGGGAELSRHGEDLLLSVSSQLPIGKLTLLKDVELKLSSEVAVQKLIEWTLSQCPTAESTCEVRDRDPAVQTSNENDIDHFCSEADRMLTQLRQRNTDLRQQCVTTLGYEKYETLLKEIPLPEVSDDEVEAQLPDLFQMH